MPGKDDTLIPVRKALRAKLKVLIARKGYRSYSEAISKEIFKR